VTSETRPDGQVTTYTYDANGNLASLTPPGRPAHAFAYTPVDLTTQYSPPDVNPGADTTQYTYNFEKQPVLTTRPDGQTIAYGYDSAGRTSTVTIARGTLTYAYDPATGNPASVSAPGGIGLAYGYDGSLLTTETWTGPVAGTVARTYDANFRQSTDLVNGANAIAYGYDADGLLTSAGGLTLSRSSQNGLLLATALGTVTETYTYNGFAEPVGYRSASGLNSLYAVDYARDALGRISTLTETLAAVTSVYGYGYDLAGRLVSVSLNGAPLATYSYDANGNRLGGSYDQQDRLTAYGPATFTYTSNGERLSKVSAGQTTTYTYDALSNLLGVGLPGGTHISYLVDGQNRRVEKLVNGGRVQALLYEDDLRPAAELGLTNTVVSRFVYAGWDNVPDYMVKGGATYRFIVDHAGSPRLVVNAATGVVAQRLDYDAFGRVLTDTNPGFQPFGFAGGLYDPLTGLVHPGLNGPNV